MAVPGKGQGVDLDGLPSEESGDTKVGSSEGP